MEQREVIILSPEIDFCMLMCFYLEKKGCMPYYRNTLREGLKVIEQRKPHYIIADANISSDLKTMLPEKMSSIPDYYPKIFWLGIPDPRPFEYKLKRPEQQNPTMLDEFFEEIKRLLKKWSKKR